MLEKLTKPLMVILLVCSGFASAALEKTKNEVIKSKIMGEDRQITVQLPTNYDPNGSVKYPVLYLLDGPGHLDHTASTMEYLHRSGEMPQLLIVGLSNTDRTLEMTPSVDSTFSGGTGGADKFLDFIEKEVIPLIEKKYSTAGFRLITGHSFGGLTVMHSLTTRPHLFQAHFAFSPSVQWNKKETTKKVKTFIAKNKDLESYLYMSIANEGREMHEGYLEIKDLLSKSAPAGLKWDAQHFPDETHGTVPVISQFRAYRNFFSDWSISFEVAKQGLDAVKAVYQKKSTKYGFTILPPEGILNSAGYYFMGQDDGMTMSKAFFNYAVKTYPQSANALDSLADTLEKDGQLKQALAAMDKAVKLIDKNHANFTYMQSHQQRLSQLVNK